jgi:putative flippase GtrA
VGVVNTVIDWAVYFLLTLLPFFQNLESWAKAISFVVAMVNSFIFNSLWTFRTEFKQGINKNESKTTAVSEFGVKFMVVSVIGFFLNLWTFTLARAKIFGGASKMQQLFALVLASAIVIVWNFIANKWWTYRETNQK